MTYQTLASLNTGQPIPSAQWNAMRDNQEWIAAPPMCTLTRTTSWTVTGAWHIPFTAARVDTHGFWTPDHPERATAPTDGTYLITGWCDLPTVRNAADGGPISPGQTVMRPLSMPAGGTATFAIAIQSRSVSEPYSFTHLWGMDEGDSIVLYATLTPIAAAGLSLQWVAP